jgi:hypothetical protein
MIFNINSYEVDIGLYRIWIETDNPTTQNSKGQQFVAHIRMNHDDNDHIKLADSLRYLADMLEFRWETLENK